MAILLFVDDEPGVCYGFRQAFSEPGVEVVTAATVAEGLDCYRRHRPDVVVLDLQLPDGSGLEAFEAIRGDDPRVPVIFITAHGTSQTAIEAMKHGAFDYLVKPVNLGQLTEILRRALEAARSSQAPAAGAGAGSSDDIIGRSPVIQEMCKAIGRIAPQDVNVLIRGESGAGKELVARSLYEHSRRVGKPFVAINCAALPETLIESELFGHEAGAFTGADRLRVGKFEQADEGTIFLDEIGDMPLAAQAKILRLIQDQQFERVGGSRSLRTRVRILAATNQNLEKLIEEGRFRRDLYYRLRVVTMTVPPLRERGDDVLDLAEHFLSQYVQELGLSICGFAPETLEAFRRYDWPGNVRELQGVIKESMLRAHGQWLLPEFLPAYLQPGAPQSPPPKPAEGEGLEIESFIESLLRQGEKDLHAKVTEAVERRLLSRVLRQTRGHQAAASELLGITRTTLRYKLRDLGIAVDRVVLEEPREENGRLG